MTSNTRAKITIGNNSVELEGSEEFVTRQLDTFRGLLEKSDTPQQAVHQDGNNGTTLKQVSRVVKPDTKPEGKSKKKSKFVEAEHFDIDKKDTMPALEEFFHEKISDNNTTREKLLVIAYYVQCIRNLPSFSEGNIDYGYKVLDVRDRPVRIYQMIIDSKNDKGWYEKADDGKNWKLTQAGQLYVDRKLPSEQDKK